MLVVIVVLSTAHLGVLIGEEIWKPPRFLISVESLLDVFGYFVTICGTSLLTAQNCAYCTTYCTSYY